MSFALAYDDNARKQLEEINEDNTVAAQAVDSEAMRLADRPFRLNAEGIHYGFACFTHKYGDGYRIDYVILEEDEIPTVLVTGIKSVWLR